jgi:site-specific DNA recombinase
MKKKAIAYTRISDKDQSKHSLSGQLDFIQDHCKRNDIELIASFADDGISAKNFDRPDWKLLEQFIKENHAAVDYLLVCWFSRFSRDTKESLQKIQMIEQRYGIMIISVFEPIHMDPATPMYFKVRADLLVGGEYELRVIRERTMFGIHNATKSGRYVNRAPLGYKNSRDDQDKPILIIDESKAVYIRKIFDLFLGGTQIEVIRKTLAVDGFRIKGTSGVQQILTSPTYGGLVKVTAYYSEQERLIKGIHEPLITEAKWWKVQSIINENKGRSHLVVNDEVPLRGSLQCAVEADGRICDKLLTAGNSKSRSGKYHWYYHCNIKAHRRINLSAAKLHTQFDEIWQELTFNPLHLKYLEDKAITRTIETMKDQYEMLADNQKQLKSLKGKIESLEEKYIDNDIDKATYLKWRARYLSDQGTLEASIANLKDPLEKRMERTHAQLANLNNLAWLFQKATIAQKQTFIRCVFGNNLYHQDGCYRTTFILPIFSPKAALLKEKGLLIVDEQPLEIRPDLEKCPEQESNLHYLAITRF